MGSYKKETKRSELEKEGTRERKGAEVKEKKKNPTLLTLRRRKRP